MVAADQRSRIPGQSLLLFADVMRCFNRLGRSFGQYLPLVSHRLGTATTLMPDLASLLDHFASD